MSVKDWINLLTSQDGILLWFMWSESERKITSWVGRFGKSGILHVVQISLHWLFIVMWYIYMAYFSVEGRLTAGGFSKIKLCSERFVRCDADVPGVIRDQDDERTPETSNSFILCCTLVTLKSNVFLCVCFCSFSDRLVLRIQMLHCLQICFCTAKLGKLTVLYFVTHWWLNYVIQ